MRRSLVAMLLLPFVGACGDAPADPSRSEAWHYTMITERLSTTPQPGDVQCQVASATMILSVLGDEFEGSVDGNVTCAAIGDLLEVVFERQVSDGIFDAQAVSFRMGTWQHEGNTSSDGMMSGTATMEVRVDGVTKALTGVWAATSQ